MNIDALQNRKDSVLATARELASGDGDLAQVKSLMAEAKGIEERIETIKALGQGHPVATETPAYRHEHDQRSSRRIATISILRNWLLHKAA